MLDRGNYWFVIFPVSNVVNGTILIRWRHMIKRERELLKMLSRLAHRTCWKEKKKKEKNKEKTTVFVSIDGRL